MRQFNYLVRLRKSQWLTLETLHKIQEKKVHQIVKYAYSNIPYYHELFKSLDIKPVDIKILDDLRKIPVLTKSEIQNNFAKFLPNNFDHKRYHFRRTSGSTGKPLTIYLDEKTYVSVGSRQLRAYFECGLKPRDKICNFSAPNHFKNNKKWYNYINFMRQENYSIFEPIHNHIDKLLKYCPDVIQSYPSILYLMAQELKERKIDEINPRLIFTTSELLTKKFRNTINSAFNTHLFDQYGSVEFGTFAWECSEHNGYHIDTEDVVVEFLKNQEQSVAPGEEGEIVVTSLSNYVMPLIRYSLGDIGVPSDELCSCGRGLPKMELVCGRKDGFLCLPSGKLISPRNVGSLEYINGINNFKIIQEMKNKIVVQVVKGKDFSRETINKIKEVILSGCYRENVAVIVKPVKQIENDASGKNRMIFSKVNN